MDASKIEFVSEKLIKPSSETPSHLKSFNLSLLDQLTTPMYIPIALFFPRNESIDPTQIPQILENSLSDLLSIYYPFAGTVKNNVSIDCNDLGATFLEVNIKSPMSEIVKDSVTSVQDIVFPAGLPWSLPEEKQSLLIVQLSHFGCGGRALSLSTSHKVADGCTATRFLADWSVLALQSAEIAEIAKPSPQFIGATLFPPNSTDPPTVTFHPEKMPGVISKRFRFDAKSIAQLKAKVSAESGVQNPTRVEVVTALLYKSAMAANIENSGAFRPSNLVFVANFRPLAAPPLPSTAVGNFYYYLDASISSEEEMDLSKLASDLRKVKIELKEKCKKLKPSELLSFATETDEKMDSRLEQDMYICSSFCGYPTYRLDFGFGRPEKVILGGVYTKNVFMLMDDQNEDGVEALVALDESVMSIFERNEEIVAFSSLKTCF